jgi:adenylate cyclase
VTPEEFVAHLEIEVLGPARLSIDELIVETGIDLTDAEELWLGLGFPVTGADGLRFTDADAAVLRSLLALRTEGLTGPEVIIPMTRVLGQALSRVAIAEVEIFREPLMEAIAAVGEAGAADVDLEAITERLVGGFEQFVSYVWRRQLVAALRRELLDEGSETEVVGFVDLVDYTRDTRDLADEELSDVLARFQRMVYDQVTSVEGRVVKVIGDGAMFTTRSPEEAATAALGLVAAAADDEKLRGVRVGLARGHVVALDGDLYGETVNRASRLADHAYPHTVLVDDATGEALAEQEGVRAKRTKPHKLKGLGTEQTWVVRPPRASQDHG